MPSQLSGALGLAMVTVNVSSPLIALHGPCRDTADRAGRPPTVRCWPGALLSVHPGEPPRDHRTNT